LEICLRTPTPTIEFEHESAVGTLPRYSGYVKSPSYPRPVHTPSTSPTPNEDTNEPVMTNSAGVGVRSWISMPILKTLLVPTRDIRVREMPPSYDVTGLLYLSFSQC
jgi:hypothetical protein